MSTTTSSTATRAASSRIQLSDGSYGVVASSYKRVIICCDGTWQGSDKGTSTMPSNVARMVKAIAPKRHDVDGHETQQVVYYQSGVGTSTMGRIGNVAAGATGGGLDDNVLEAYYFLCNNVEPDDEIFLFGFSRGAYTVRTLAGLLDVFDIIDRYSLHQFPELYAAYKERTQDNEKEFKDMYARLSVLLEDNKVDALTQVINSERIAKYKAAIKVIGVFDTVGSMGIPENTVVRSLDLNRGQKFRDPRLSMKVENAFHALALDEHRQAFTPTMWHTPFETRDKTPYQGPNLVQTWFPGVHINIGGGNTDNKPQTIPNNDPHDGILTPSEFVKKNESWTSWLGSKVSSGVNAVNIFAANPEMGSDKRTTYSNADDEEMADIVLMWMIDRCRPFLEFNETYLNYLVEEHKKKLEVIRKRSVNTVSRIFGYRTDLKFGYACGPIQDSFGGVMALGGSRRRAPGQYTSNYTSGNIVDETRDSHHTHEYIHPSARWRYFENGDEYKNARGLDGFKLADYTNDFEKSPVKDDVQSTGVVWEKKIAKPLDKSRDILRVSEGRVPKEIKWIEIVGDRKVVRSEVGLEYRLMGDTIWNALQKGQSFDTPIKGKSFYQG